jgi:hypothetical protein
MLSFIGRTWPLWWTMAIGLGLRWHYVLVAGSQPDEVNEAAHETEEMWEILPERCTGTVH